MPKSPTFNAKVASLPFATASRASAEISGSLEQRIGREIRSLRTRLGLTCSELAKFARISTSMMSKIETGQISASLGTFEAIAHALNVSVASIFSGTEIRRDCSFVRAGTGVRINRRGTKAGHQYDLIGHSVAGPLVVEPYLITLAADAEPYTSFQHAGVELIYMLTGRVAYRHGESVYDMSPGDTLFFDATAHHGPERMPELPSTYLSIIAYPRA